MTVDQFVGWLFEADGVDPSEDLPNGKSTSMGFATRSYATWAAVPSMSNVWRGSTADAQFSPFRQRYLAYNTDVCGSPITAAN